MLGNPKNLSAICVFRDFQHRYTYVLIKIKVMLITESNRLVIDTQKGPSLVFSGLSSKI